MSNDQFCVTPSHGTIASLTNPILGPLDWGEHWLETKVEVLQPAARWWRAELHNSELSKYSLGSHHIQCFLFKHSLCIYSGISCELSFCSPIAQIELMSLNSMYNSSELSAPPHFIGLKKHKTNLLGNVKMHHYA